MLDLHTHTFFSDGSYVPAELARRCKVKGYRGLALTDHCDHSNLASVLEKTTRFARETGGAAHGVKVLPGCEITHAPPELVPDLVQRARELGAEVVLVHGESLAEPVAEGTNEAAVEAGADVLAHPGLVSEEVARKAAENDVLLEVSARKGHCLTNGHVVQTARRTGAGLSFGSDGHEGSDYPTLQHARNIAAGAGMEPDEIRDMFANNARLLDLDPPSL